MTRRCARCAGPLDPGGIFIDTPSKEWDAVIAAPATICEGCSREFLQWSGERSSDPGRARTALVTWLRQSGACAARDRENAKGGTP
jgi:hypothetical protein